MEQIRKICKYCQSESITKDALVSWNGEEWEIASILDNGDCAVCGESGGNLVVTRYGGEEKAGLRFIGCRRLGNQVYNFYECPDCSTCYPDMGKGPQANGVVLKRCLCK